jgi:hypothetical protein
VMTADDLSCALLRVRLLTASGESLGDSFKIDFHIVTGFSCYPAFCLMVCTFSILLLETK